MEAAYISALRTAAVAMVTAQHLGPTHLRTAAFLGCGTLAKAHLSLLPAHLPAVERVVLFDLYRDRAESLGAALRAEEAAAALDVRVAGTAEDCVRDADLVVPVTTVTEGYIPFEWLEPGAVVAHVSLDDVLSDVVEGASLVLT